MDAPFVERTKYNPPLSYFSSKLARGELDIATLLGVQQYAASLIHCGVTIADAQAKSFPMVYCDRGFLELTGYSLGEVIGRSCSFLQGEATNPKTVARIRQGLYKDMPEAVDVVVLNYRKDGSSFWNELHIEPIFDDAQRLTHFIGVQKDVTQQVQKSKALADSSIELVNLHIKMERLEAMVAQLLDYQSRSAV